MKFDLNSPTETLDRSITFYTDYLDSVRALRSGLIDAFQTLGIESTKPREAARQLGLDKSLAWKITRIIHEDDASRIASSIPGNSGMKQVTDSLVERKLPSEIADSITRAYDNYKEMADVHATDKPTLELMLDGMNTLDEENNQKSRQFAFRGNCGIWGIQSSVRISAHVLAVNRDDPTLLDYAGFGGLTGFQRLRPGPPWPIFQFLSFEDTGKPMRSDMIPISASPDPDFPLIINEFCKGTMPELNLATQDNHTNYEFADGIIGKTGASDVFLGYIDTIPKPRYQDEHNQFGELLCLIDTPIETLVFDLIVEEQLARNINPKPTVYGRAVGAQYSHEMRSGRHTVPFAEPLRKLDPGPHMLTTPLVPSYAQLGETVISKMDRSITDFVCWRLIMKYPIMPSTVSMMFDLEQRPGT